MSDLNKIAELMEIEIPADIQAEQSVLGAVLLEASAFESIKEKLQGGEFYDKANARIFRAMTKVYESGVALDLVSISSQLVDSKEIDKIGGVSYLTRLAGVVPSAANVEFYVDRVKEMFFKRQAIEQAYDLLEHAAYKQDYKGFITLAEVTASKLNDQTAPARQFKNLKSVLMEVWEQSEERYNNRDKERGVTGLASGFTDLDKMTAGFQKSDLIIVAARPSVGKTAFALNIAQNVGVKLKEDVAIFSLEMSAEQLVQRMISAAGNIEGDKLKTGFFEGNDWEKMSTAISILADANIHIDDTPGITVHEIRRKCRQLKKERGLGLILIDYLQLIQGRSKGADNRQQEVSEISRTLKQIARELEVPVIALSQLSRGVEQRKDKRPMMSDLRESGSIEQDADIVAFLYRDDYYDKQSEMKNIVEVIIAKQRNGPVGTVELAFLKQYGKMLDLDRQQHVGDHNANW